MTYNLGQLVVANYACAEAGSGAQTCTGTVNNLLPINTLLPGTHSLTVTAKDLAGNTASQTVSYTVATHVGGNTPTADLRSA